MEELLLSLNTMTNENHNVWELVKSNHSEYAQLNLMCKTNKYVTRRGITNYK